MTSAGGTQNQGVFYSLTASGESVLYNFGSQSSDGSDPSGNLAEDTSGNFYGTTTLGGDLNCIAVYGCGTVFRLTPPLPGQTNWTETVLYAFQESSDGFNAAGGVILDAASGNLYGTTAEGGTGIDCCGEGGGVVFELSPEPAAGCPSRSNTGYGWCETVLYNFCSQPSCTDGQFPLGPLALDAKGNLYGTAGVVFELSPEPVAGCPSGSNTGYGWCETVLYDGGTGSDAGVVLYQGSLFGTTSLGGSSGCDCGTVYQLSPPKQNESTWTYALLHQFGMVDGAYPTELLADPAGNLYGTTEKGGIPSSCVFNFPLGVTNFGCGTVFELSRSAGGKYSFSSLYRFAGGTDGADPQAQLNIDSNDNLYGTTASGGGTGCALRAGCGTDFELSPQGGGVWREYVLNRFNLSNGAVPASKLCLTSSLTSSSSCLPPQKTPAIN
jgi:uncharacterized repeat protein (TIGR03803 family)